MNKAILALGVTGVLIYSFPMPSVCAANHQATCNNEVQPLAAGLIRHCNLSVSEGSNSNIVLNGYIACNSSMSSIGIKNIKVKYSTNGTSWSDTNYTVNDLLGSGMEYYINNYSIPVASGYYYCVECDFYAKESGLFGDTQSISYTSNSVLVE